MTAKERKRGKGEKREERREEERGVRTEQARSYGPRKDAAVLGSPGTLRSLRPARVYGLVPFPHRSVTQAPDQLLREMCILPLLTR